MSCTDHHNCEYFTLDTSLDFYDSPDPVDDGNGIPVAEVVRGVFDEMGIGMGVREKVSGWGGPDEYG